jgi:nicotinamidase-related amidase
MSLTLDPQKTALVFIDLQNGIVAMPTAPYSGPAIVKKALRLADHFRAKGSLIVWVHVGFSADGKDAPKSEVDAPMNRGNVPPSWSELVPEIQPYAADFVIKKRQWGAFYGTELDLQLRRRGIERIILGGIATNFGVESTARDAFERGYKLILVEDAMTSVHADAHNFSVKTIFPRLGFVRSTEDVLAAAP